MAADRAIPVTSLCLLVTAIPHLPFTTGATQALIARRIRRRRLSSNPTVSRNGRLTLVALVGLTQRWNSAIGPCLSYQQSRLTDEYRFGHSLPHVVELRHAQQYAVHVGSFKIGASEDLTVARDQF